jgi:prepilin-type N-terminal cleavage/methylation domain-containing protein
MSKEVSLNKTEEYAGFSLIEMLITITIMGFLLLLVGQTFAVMVKTAMMTEMKTATRNDVEMAKELLEKYLQSADIELVTVYDSKELRYFDPNTGVVKSAQALPPIEEDRDPISIPEEPIKDPINPKDPVYPDPKNPIIKDPINVLGTSTSPEVKAEATEVTLLNPLDEGVVGNEVHIQPANSDRVICIGYFRDQNDKGYLLKSSMPAGTNPIHCFNPDTQQYKMNTMILNSSDVNVDGFAARYINVEENGYITNLIFEIEISAIPDRWPGSNSPTPTVRTLYVKSNKLQIN